jgi:hypothetical protein
MLLYIQMAQTMETTTKSVLKDLVAEARTRGIVWAEIGHALGIKDTAAQKVWQRHPAWPPGGIARREDAL